MNLTDLFDLSLAGRRDAAALEFRNQTLTFGEIDERSNRVAYLFAQRYFDEEGNAARGAQVFDEKNCKSCHEQRRLETRAPDLTIATERYSPITLSASVWRHGPAMLEAIQEKELAWPEFSGSEMSDLIAYLNSRLVPRIANPKE